MLWRRRRQSSGLRGGLSAFLDEGSEIEGKYICAGTVMLNGKLRGEINSSGTLIVGERGVLNATVRAVVVVIHGEVVGNVEATERIELKGSARVVGDVEAPVIVVEEGVRLDGHCQMSKGKSGETSLALVAVK